MFKKINLLAIVFFTGQNMLGIFPINMFQPYDINLKPEKHNSKLQITMSGEFGKNVRALDLDGNKVNILQMWQPTQNALAMVKGFNPFSELGQLSQRFNKNDDDGVRGHFLTTADFSMIANIPLAVRFNFPKNLTLSIFAPFLSMEIKNVKWEELTKNINNSDIRVKRLLTDDFFGNIKKYGNGLDLGDWHESGLGDLTLMIDWLKDFPQEKPLLKNVRLNLRGGISFPTGIKTDADKIVSLPFGNDGSFAYLFGGGLNLNLSDFLRFGIDAEFLYQGGNTRERRIKTDRDQTDLLLLEKAMVYKSYGFTQRFDLHLQAYRIIKGFSCNIAYQYWKHNDDKLNLSYNSSVNNASNVIINTAKNLEEWTFHNIIFHLTYDFNQDRNKRPQIGLFYKKPTKGKGCLLVDTIGFNFTFNF